MIKGIACILIIILDFPLKEKNRQIIFNHHDSHDLRQGFPKNILLCGMETNLEFEKKNHESNNFLGAIFSM